LTDERIAEMKLGFVAPESIIAPIANPAAAIPATLLLNGTENEQFRLSY